MVVLPCLQWLSIALLLQYHKAFAFTCYNDNKAHYPDITRQPDTSDVQAIIDSLNANSFSPVGGSGLGSPIHVLKAQTVVLDYQTARVCIVNPGILFSTFVGMDQVSSALTEFRNTCCPDLDQPCQGGSTGVDHLVTNIDHSAQVFIFVQHVSDGVKNGCLGGQTSNIVELVTSWAVGTIGIAAAIPTLALSQLTEAELFALRYGSYFGVSAMSALLKGFAALPEGLVLPLADIVNEQLALADAAAYAQRVKDILGILDAEEIITADAVSTAEAGLAAAEEVAVGIAILDDGFDI